MRVLVAIPHYFGPPARGRSHGSQRQAGPRVEALRACLAGLRQQFARPQCVIQIARRTTQPANTTSVERLDVVVCTTGDRHLLGELRTGPGEFEHRPTRAEPLLLGFECHAVLSERLGAYDYYAYLEDDLIVRDPWFFAKLAWFVGHVGEEALLQPNRYEFSADGPIPKAYIDGDIVERATADFQNVAEVPCVLGEALGVRVAFRRALNPHSGAFFLTAGQMAHWVRQPTFLDRDVRFIGPLESAASLGVMRTFRVYKPAPENANFLEIEHFGTGFLSQIRMPPSSSASGSG